MAIYGMNMFWSHHPLLWKDSITVNQGVGARDRQYAVSNLNMAVLSTVMSRDAVLHICIKIVLETLLGNLVSYDAYKHSLSVITVIIVTLYVQSESTSSLKQSRSIKTVWVILTANTYHWGRPSHRKGHSSLNHWSFADIPQTKQTSPLLSL
jgi:hypothetical protein